MLVFYAYFRNPVLFGRLYHFTYSSVDFRGDLLASMS